MLWIGIDTGVHTGLAIWDSGEKKLLSLETLLIHQAMEKVLYWHYKCDGDCTVIFEDARQRKWFGQRSNAKQQGAGSVKRDAKIWEDFLRDKGITFRAVPPQKGATKLSAEQFKNITGWQGRTSEHARDAAMLVYRH